MFLLIYNLALQVYFAGIRLVSPWNPKAKLALKGREELFKRIEEKLQNNKLPVVWMHCASLGEFEQGRSLLEILRKEEPATCIVVTFFSPSGYEAAKNYKTADHIFYLPFPGKTNAKRFIGLVKPKLVLWIKYDYWYYYLKELKKQNIPLLLISAIFHKHQPFFKWYGPLYREMLHCFTWLFVQTPGSAARLSSIGIRKNVTVNGDTRFDRVIDIAENFRPTKEIEDFIGTYPVIVAGSTWKEDEEELDHYANSHKNIKFIIAPHEIDEDHLKEMEKLFHHTIRYSALKTVGATNKNTLIIDNIGMLSRLYRYATISYIGGGFGSDGIHNALEAAVYGKPVVFGPVFNKYREAIELLEEGAAFTIENALELEKTLDDLLADEKLYQESCNAAKKYVYAHKGATQNIMHYIQENRLLTNW